MMIDLINEALPDGETLPRSYKEATGLPETWVLVMS
jgi:hypothetical protein